MELELNGKSHVFYDTGARLTATREQTQEQVVPDARPDILRIVNAYGCVLAERQSLTDGRAEVSGSVRAAVLYLPEEGQGLEYLNLTIPFTQAFELSCDGEDLLFCRAELESIDARTINPRKVLVRAGVRVSARVVRRREGELAYGAGAGDRLGVHTLVEKRMLRVATAATAKTFTVGETMEMNGAPAIGEIIFSDLKLRAGDCNVIGRRVVFKGMAETELLYRSVDGRLCSHRSELPFSQILEPEGVEEGAEIIIRLRVCDMAVSLRGEEGGSSFELEFSAEAQAVAYADHEFEVVADLYSTAKKATVETGILGVETFCGRSERRTTLRSALDTGNQARDTEDVTITFTQPVASKGESGSGVECTAEVKVRYVGEDGLHYAAHSKIPVRIDREYDRELCAEFRAENIAASAAAAGGVDLRFDAVADMEEYGLVDMTCVRRAALEDFDPDAPARPSVVLRYPSPGESMWQVAKRYLTTEADIRQANGLGDGDAPDPDRLMLIPKRR